jgi:xylulokinase
MTMSSGILSLDLGTSSLKAAFFLGDLPVVSLGRFVYTTPDTAGWLLALEQVFSMLSVRQKSELAIITISGQGPTLVPILRNGEALKPLFYFDQSMLLPNEKSFFLPKMVYFKVQQPQLYQQVQAFISAPDFLVYALTGAMVTSLPQVNYESLLWSEASLLHYGIDKTLMPPFKTPQMVDNVRPAWVKKFGLNPHVAVSTTLFDFLAALLGAGCVESGMVLNRAGMSEGVTFVLDDNDDGTTFKDMAQPWRITPHVIAGLYNRGVVFNEAGKLWDENNHDVHSKPMQEHIAKVVGLWNRLPASKIKEVRLCGGQAYSLNLINEKRRLSQHLVTTSHSPEAELWGNQAVALHLTGQFTSLKAAAQWVAQSYK